MATTLRPFRRSHRGVCPARGPGRIRGRVGETRSIPARIAPGLRESLDGISEPAPLDKEDERFRLFDAVAQFFIALSQRAPLLLVLDDLHWADRGTVHS